MSKKYILEDVLPHSHPMILIDDVLEYSPESLTSSVEIKSASLFLCDDTFVPAWVGIEYMAQSIAAWAGIKAGNSGQPVKSGFLVGCRTYTATQENFFLGSKLKIQVNLRYKSDKAGVFTGFIENQNKVIVEASLSVYQP